MISSLFVIIFVITLIAFCFSVPLNGYITSWMITYGIYDTRHAHREQHTNLFDYFDIVGSLCFIIFKIGWGMVVPVKRELISGSFVFIRTVLAYCIQPFSSMLIALASIIPGILLTNKACVITSLKMFLYISLTDTRADIPLQIFQRDLPAFNSYSPYALTATLFLGGIMYVQLTMLCVSMVINVFTMLFYPVMQRLATTRYSSIYYNASIFIIPLLFCIFFYQFFMYAAIECILFFIYLVNIVIKGF